MANKGFSHIGLSTLDLDKTVEFYENVPRGDDVSVRQGPDASVRRPSPDLE
jgi:catechol 2,3-dioxygenase-like lactoylglutathione lyase family enzyme